MPAPLVQKGLAENTIEIAPLAFMRGRTLASAFVILDEAQNTTPQQMKMFLTRLGEGSRMVVTGDPLRPTLPARRIVRACGGACHSEGRGRNCAYGLHSRLTSCVIRWSAGSLRPMTASRRREAAPRR
jgi:hypothetical protein